MGSQRVGRDWRLSLSIQSKCALDFHSSLHSISLHLITQAYILQQSSVLPTFFSWWVFKIFLNLQVLLLSLSFRYNLPVKESERSDSRSFPLAGKPHSHAGHHTPPFLYFLHLRVGFQALTRSGFIPLREFAGGVFSVRRHVGSGCGSLFDASCPWHLMVRDVYSLQLQNGDTVLLSPHFHLLAGVIL